MRLIDRYVSGYNAIGSRYGMLAYTLGFSDCRELLLALPVLERRRCPVDFYNLSYSLGFKQLKRLSDLARRCRDINGWGCQMPKMLICSYSVLRSSRGGNFRSSSSAAPSSRSQSTASSRSSIRGIRSWTSSMEAFASERWMVLRISYKWILLKNILSLLPLSFFWYTISEVVITSC